MFCVIYRFKLKPHQEASYQKCWDIITDYFIKHRGSLGSCLHKSEDNLWIAYSRWPDKPMRDASWPGDDAPNQALPDEVVKAIEIMQGFKKENADLAQYDEITMDMVMDKLADGYQDSGNPSATTR